MKKIDFQFFEVIVYLMKRKVKHSRNKEGFAECEE
jgi:hypothetical protein